MGQGRLWGRAEGESKSPKPHKPFSRVQPPPNIKCSLSPPPKPQKTESLPSVQASLCGGLHGAVPGGCGAGGAQCQGGTVPGASVPPQSTPSPEVMLHGSGTSALPLVFAESWWWEPCPTSCSWTPSMSVAAWVRKRRKEALPAVRMKMTSRPLSRAALSLQAKVPRRKQDMLHAWGLSRPVPLSPRVRGVAGSSGGHARSPVILLPPSVSGRFLCGSAPGAGRALAAEAEGGPGGTPDPSGRAAGVSGSAAAACTAQPRPEGSSLHHNPRTQAVSAPSPSETGDVAATPARTWRAARLPAAPASSRQEPAPD